MLLFFGVLLLVLAVIFFFIGRSQKNRLDALNASEATTTDFLHKTHARIATALGADAFVQPSALHGVIECARPLKTPTGGLEAIAYRRRVVREYEERVSNTNSNGKTEVTWQKKTDEIESQERRTNFQLRDEHGVITVMPEDAELELEDGINQFEEAPRASKVSLAVGSRRELGRRTIEEIFPVGVQVSVIGCAIDYQGKPVIAKGPSDKKIKFIINRKSLRELASSAANTAKNMQYAAVGTGSVGVLLTLLGLIFL